MKEAVTEMYTITSCMRLYSVNIIDFWKGWRSKFESVNECKQVEGCVDADVIVGKFCDHFVKSYACNNALRADELRQEYVVLRRNYTVVSQLLIMITLIRRWSVKLFLI